MKNEYISRIAESTLARYLQAFPVLGVTGPRQSGKSTLLLKSLPHYRYVSFDDPQQVAYFTEDPKGFFALYDHHVIFDEVQHVPEIFNYLKLAVDRDRQTYGKFVVTGSSQFQAMKRVSESLAGRIGLFSLLPLQYAELPIEQRRSAVYRGSYPELVGRNYYESDLWYSAYIDTYLNKDVRMLTNIGDMRDFQRLIHLLAANSSQLLDLTQYARDLGVSVPTIKRWVSILEASYIIFLMSPYYENFGKRIVKSPKIYFWDTGLLSYLTGVKTEELFEKGPLAGALFENYVVADICKQQCHRKTGYDLYFLRTHEKHEVDLILDKKQTREFIEIKKTATFNFRMLKTMRNFIQEQDQGFLLYRGDEPFQQDNIRVMSYEEYLLFK